MKKMLYILGCGLMLSACAAAPEERAHNDITAPAYPLVTIDPFTSVWSFSDVLGSQPTRHWTGKNHPLVGVAVVDGKEYRFLGDNVVSLNAVAGASQYDEWEGQYVMKAPAGEWMSPSFDDRQWKTGKAAFGTMDSEGTAKTQWGEEYIWVRRHIAISEDLTGKKVYLTYSHDDDATIYVNGEKVLEVGDSAEKNKYILLSPEVVATLKTGADNVIAGYCWNRRGGALLDFGLAVENDDDPRFEGTAVQTSVEVLPTQTYYTFDCGDVELEVKFTAPFLPNNLDLVSRPVNYMTYKAVSKDGGKHDVSIYLEASPLLAQNDAFQHSTASVEQAEGLAIVKTGTVDQKILGRKGDDVRIDWGYFCMASSQKDSECGVGGTAQLHDAFRSGEALPKSECADGSLAVVNRHPASKNAEGFFMIGYDDIYSIQYFQENLRPYWNRNEDETIAHQFALAARDHDSLMKECLAFDNEMMAETAAAGGQKYASLCALAYRQSYAAHKLVQAPNGDLLWLSKENFSNGSIGTVDVTYPSTPVFLVYNNELTKGLLNHIFYYSESGKWDKPFAAHDVGTYPWANGQTYGGDMPLEECGNMVIATAAVCKADGSYEYAKKHWDILSTWIKYLVEYGQDPANQLCTDDFAGHFAHNANLSIKAIVGIGAYAQMAGKLGYKDIAEEYSAKASEMAGKWVEMAREGDHFKLTFDAEGTWSQKYNLVWDKLLGLNIFPEEVAQKEIAYYLTVQNKYGLPLDSRKDYTKNDWINWTATMAPDLETFEKFIDPVYRFVDETEDRVPLSDWTYTSKATHVGFQARSVVGGYFMKVLAERWAE